MILKNYSYKTGDQRVSSRFAWLPTRVEHYLIWLEFYQTEFVFTRDQKWVELDGHRARIHYC